MTDASTAAGGLVEGWTRRSGPRVHYLDNAPVHPRGLPVLFAPGLSDAAFEYTEMLEWMAPRRLLVVDVRGRGESDAPPTGYSAAEHAADLQAVLDQEAIEQFHLVTFSRGTTWGLDLLRSNPARVASMAIADYRAVEVRLPSTFAETQWATRYRGRPMSERLQRHVLEGVASASVARDLWDVLATLRGPLLVARAGGPGSILDEEAVQRYLAVRPDAELVVVPDAPHDVFRPDRLFYPRVVAAFLDRVEASFDHG
jgi:pimeloyl-ACP methyl ester carboxylesterase